MEGSRNSDSMPQDGHSIDADARPVRRSLRRRREGGDGSTALEQEGTGKKACTSSQPAQQPEQPPQLQLPELSLQVKWTSVTGRTKLSHLPLTQMKNCHDVTGLHKRLVTRVFSESERPASLTCSGYLQFNTAEECLNYPLDVARTSFRLVAVHDGWHYVIHETSPQGTSTIPDFIHVVSIEFETVARVIGHLGIRMSMIAYPIVAINKTKLMDVVQRLQTDPDFKGIL